MNKVIAARFKFSRNIHIVANRQDVTICGLTLPRNAELYTKVPQTREVCRKCLLEIGKEMFGDYIGLDFFE